MEKYDKSVSQLDLKSFAGVLMSNVKIIFGISIIGLLIGFLVSVGAKKDAHRIIAEVAFDELKYDIIESQFDINLADRFPVIVNTYIMPELAKNHKDYYPFSIMEGGKYQTKIVAIIDEAERNDALNRFINLSNIIKEEFEEDVYKVYMSKVNNIKYTYSKINNNILQDNLDFINNKLSEDTPENIAMGFLLGALNERLIRTNDKLTHNSFFDSNSNYDDYVDQLSLNGIYVDKPTILFGNDQNVIISKIGEQFNFAPLLGLLIGFFLSVIFIILIKSKNFNK
tara:strand:+ start:1205 stop:2053 length:849 start_codon:yes stop_codon:yes gene_type:complete